MGLIWCCPECGEDLDEGKHGTLWCLACHREPPARVICQLCRKRVHKQRNGAWYHDRNSSEFCHPGDETGRKAVPLQIGGE